MSQKSSDLRVRRTQKLLREALVALIEEHGFDAISVGEIAERAMVSRTAFYRYYQDKYDLVGKIFEEMMSMTLRDIDPLRRDVLNHLNGQSAPNPWIELFGQVAEAQQTPEAWIKLFERIGQHEQLYRALLGRKGSAWFATKMRDYIADVMSERLQALAYALNKTNVNEKRVFTDGFVLTLIAGQLVDAITWWLEQGRPYTSERIATYCYRLICSTLREVDAWD